MRAVVVSKLGGPEVLQAQDVDAPRPAAGELLIRVQGTSVNFADIMMRRGGYHSARPLPFIPGMDALGVVEAWGEGVVGWTRGQRVIAYPSGSYAEYATVEATLAVLVPESVDATQAQAAGLVGATAYELVTRAARLKPGETVLVHAAAGGVGTALVQMARHLGAGRVIAAVGHAEKAGLPRDLGADAVITGDWATWAEQMGDVTSGGGVDAIFNPLGGDAVAADLSVLNDFGRLVVYGQAVGAAGVADTSALYARNQRVVGYSFGHIRRTRPQWVRPVAAAMLEWLRAGVFRLPVSARFPLEQAAAAQALVESGMSVGKVLIDVNQVGSASYGEEDPVDGTA